MTLEAEFSASGKTNVIFTLGSMTKNQKINTEKLIHLFNKTTKKFCERLVPPSQFRTLKMFVLDS